MSRKFAKLGVAMLLAAVAVIAFLRVRHEHQLVESWRSGRWDTNASWLANQERRRERLRSLAPVAVKILRKHLHHDPVIGRWRDKTPSWLPSLMEDQIGRSAIEAENVQSGAARDLAALGAGAREALPDLIRLTAAPVTLSQCNIALAIGSIGKNTAEARAALSKLATNRHPQIAACAAFGLWRLDPRDAVAQKQLESFLDPLAFVSLAWPLCEMGEKAKPLAPAVRRAFDQVKNITTKFYTARALWLMTGDSEVPLALINSLAEEYESAGKQPLATARRRAAQDFSSAALVFSDNPECRAALRPWLEKFRLSEDARERTVGEFGLAEFQKAERDQGVRK